MRTSNYPISTLRETPADAETTSHKLMLKAGLIKRLASGLYTWMPYGLRVLRKVEHIIREEMDKAGGIELLMPTIQPAELWQESGRWEQYGPELLRFYDRNKREFCYGPTHEEVITDYARKELNSYKQLPATFYQIQTKFRDEIRPRFGVMRSREFLMKDAYSFHIDQESLQKTYDTMYITYCKIFDRLGLTYRAVQADSGSIGGHSSHEFHVLAPSGEDAIVYSNESDYAANIELAKTFRSEQNRPDPSAGMITIDTPNAYSIKDICQELNVTADKTLKTLLVNGEDDSIVALLLRGDHELNEIKAANIDGIRSPLTLASDEQIFSTANCKAGFIGPLGLNIRIIADYSTYNMADFICGANKKGKHLINVNWIRDLPEVEFTDLRNVVEGEKSPDGKGTLHIVRGVEIGHIFQLGDKYSKALNATVLNDKGKPNIMKMGCYGIGVSRIVAAAIEQNNDTFGIIWPETMSPFKLVIVPINYHKSEKVKEKADEIYTQLKQQGYDILLDDRDMRPGAMFADLELLGISHRIVISERGINNDELEYKGRTDDKAEIFSSKDIYTMISTKLTH